MNILIEYVDWLLLTRNSIEPKIGDKIYNVLTKTFSLIDETDIDWIKGYTDKAIRGYFMDEYIQLSDVEFKNLLI